MKKTFIIVMILVAGATSTYALNPVDYKVFYKMNNPHTFNGLMKYLDVNREQVEGLKNVFILTENKIETALNIENEINAEKALNFNLGNVKNILTQNQYKKYLTIVNLTINNRYEEVLLTENLNK